jgi:coenzyme F420-reducing hydrogenase delta subunit
VQPLDRAQLFRGGVAGIIVTGCRRQECVRITASEFTSMIFSVQYRLTGNATTYRRKACDKR